MSRWTDHVAKWQDCKRCPLWRGRTKVVLARGQLPADVLFCGEAPGESEDLIGDPFVGPAGKLLDGIVDDALSRADVRPSDSVRLCWTNLVACFPKEEKEMGVNEPPDEAIRACRPRLFELVEISRPKVIVCVGTLARDWLDPKAVRLKDKILPWPVPRVDVKHPAFILRLPSVQQGFEIKRAVLTIASAIQEHCLIPF